MSFGKILSDSMCHLTMDLYADEIRENPVYAVTDSLNTNK